MHADAIGVSVLLLYVLQKLSILIVTQTISLHLYLVMSISVPNYVLQQTLVYKLPLDRHLELVLGLVTKPTSRNAWLNLSSA